MLVTWSLQRRDSLVWAARKFVFWWVQKTVVMWKISQCHHMVLTLQDTLGQSPSALPWDLDCILFAGMFSGDHQLALALIVILDNQRTWLLKRWSVGSWTRWSLKVPSKPFYDSIIFWNYVWKLIPYSRLRGFLETPSWEPHEICWGRKSMFIWRQIHVFMLQNFLYFGANKEPEALGVCAVNTY